MAVRGVRPVQKMFMFGEGETVAAVIVAFMCRGNGGVGAARESARRSHCFMSGDNI